MRQAGSLSFVGRIRSSLILILMAELPSGKSWRPAFPTKSALIRFLTQDLQGTRSQVTPMEVRYYLSSATQVLSRLLQQVLEFAHLVAAVDAARQIVMLDREDASLAVHDASLCVQRRRQRGQRHG